MSIENMNFTEQRQDFASLDLDAANLFALLEGGDSSNSWEHDPELLDKQITGYVDSLNDQYFNLKKFGIVVSFMTVAAKLGTGGSLEFFRDDGGDVNARSERVCMEGTPDEYTRTVNVVGCFDGFDVLTTPTGQRNLYMRSNQGGLMHWSKL